MKAVILTFTLVLFSLGQMVRAQGMNTYFGQSAKQHRTFEWQYISSDNFDAYFYDDQQQMAEYALRFAEKKLKDLELLIDYRMGGRSQILLYTSTHDLEQSGILQVETAFLPGTYAYTLENKIIVRLEGELKDIEKQISYGLAELLVSELMYGGSFQERLQASTLLYLPEWFYKGLLAYVSEPWNTELDSRVKDAFEQKRFHQFNRLAKEDANLAGHSWWYFISRTYGDKSIADILYLTRVSRSFESAILFVLGTPSRKLFREWLQFYETEYASDAGNPPYRDAIRLPEKLSRQYMEDMKLSPNGKQLLLAVSIQSKKSVWLYDSEKKNFRRIYQSGFQNRTRGETYKTISIAWTPDSKSFYLSIHQKGKLHLIRMNTSGRILNEYLPEVDLIQHISHHPTEKTLLFSARKKGFSDLYLWNPSSNQLSPLTLDQFDDLSPEFSPDGESIYFLSDRNGLFKPPGDSIFLAHDSVALDVYLIPVHSGNASMVRLTKTNYIRESRVIVYGDSLLAYLSNNSGISNVYAAELKNDYSMLHFPLSDFSRDVLFLDAQNQREASLMFYHGAYYLNLLPVSEKVREDSRHIRLHPTSYRQFAGHQAFISDSNGGILVSWEEITSPRTPKTEPQDTVVVKALPYYFQTGFPDMPVRVITPETGKSISINRNSRNYQLNLLPEFYSTNLLDNSIINTYYYPNTPFSSLFNQHNRYAARLELGISDLFRNHRLIVGARLPLSFYGTDVYLDYLNRKYALDFGISGFRSSRLADSPSELNRIFIHEVRPYMLQPLGGNWHLRYSAFFRSDRITYVGTDQNMLLKPDLTTQWLGAKAELIFDNVELRNLNFPVGLRFKAYSELFYSVSNARTYLVNSGMDMRYYKPLHTHVLWASRISLNTSAGSRLTLYQVGGAENWISPRYNEALGSASGYNYQMIGQMNGIRGFNQNIRNGQNALVFSTELRVPLYNFLLRFPANFDFIRNLQWVAFTDIGSAWNTWNPFSEQHYNTRVIDQGSVRITVRNKNNPFVTGLGTGLRTRLLGFPLRLDAAWAIENGQLRSTKPLFLFSFGFDF